MKCFIDRLLVAISVCLVIALLSVNAVFVTAECPNYTASSSSCPSAPPAYNHGNCTAWVQTECEAQGALYVGLGNYTLITQNGFQIVSNETPTCYIVTTCSWKCVNINGVYTYGCTADYDSFVGYAYVSGGCPG